MSYIFKKYKIYWKSEITGESGHSIKPMTFNTAKTWVNDLQKKYPEIKHWIM